jgi:hypothetical protein
MAWGRRCDLGCESWPDDDIYETCPVCGEPAERFSNLRPLSEKDARSLRLHLAFEEFYADWCNDVGQPSDGLLEPTEEQHKKYDALYPGGRPDNPTGTKELLVKTPS